MQELLGRLGALDPQASQSLRVIACFDELMSGGVALRGLVSAAAALAGAPAGFQQGQRLIRVDSRGEELSGPAPAEVIRVEIRGGASLWIERDPSIAFANDDIILERFALAAGLRLNPATQVAGRDVVRRSLASLLDQSNTKQERLVASTELHLVAGTRYRALTAPLFTSWVHRPSGPEDVIWTSFGPVHVVIVHDGSSPAGNPLGLGIATESHELGLSFRTALIALRLHDGTADTPICADDLGGLAEMLAELPDEDRVDRDGEGIGEIMQHSWGYATIAALVDSTSIREAAREVGVHHSTMATRMESVIGAVGFDPLTGLGRTRLGIAFLRWRLRNSRVLELPSPTD